LSGKEEEMTRTKMLIGVGAVVGVLAIAVAAVGLTAGDTIAGVADSDEPITGSALAQASAAALAHTGEGRVTDTEVGDEESYYEVEVTLDDGSQVDVQLDENFSAVSEDKDDESADTDDAGE
jgi:hypothetical protein